MAKKEKENMIGPVVPVRIIDGHADMKQVDWLMAHFDPGIGFKRIATDVDKDGVKSSIFLICGFGGKKLSRMYNKEFYGGDGACHIMFDLDALFKPIKK